MVLKQRRVTLLWASCAHSGHDCHLPRGIGPCSPRSNPSRAPPASRSRRSQRLPATRSTLCFHASSSVHPLFFLTILGGRHCITRVQNGDDSDVRAISFRNISNLVLRRTSRA